MDLTHPTPVAPTPPFVARQESIPRPSTAGTASTALSPASTTSPISNKRRYSEIEQSTGNNDGRSIQSKRACDNCKQQKLKCNVQQQPFQECSRCAKLNLGCHITNHFKRIPKRETQAHVEQENRELKEKLRRYEIQLESFTVTGAYSTPTVPGAHTTSNTKGLPTSSPNPSITTPTPPSFAIPSTSASLITTAVPAHSSSHFQSTPGALADMPSTHDISAGHSLIQLRQQGRDTSASNIPDGARKIESVILSVEEIDTLYSRFFNLFHPFLPILDPSKSAIEYHQLHEMLYWIIMFVGSRDNDANSSRMETLRDPVMRLINTILSDNPTNYHIIKGLCLICTWPPHTSITTTDPTFNLAGRMMALAMNLGLHRPSHLKDFSRSNVVLQTADVQDRLRTWTACNIVAQRVSTGYGQPPISQFDYILRSEDNSTFAAAPTTPELKASLLTEIFVNRISKKLYKAPVERIYQQWESEGRFRMKTLQSNIPALDTEIRGAHPLEELYFLAAQLHLHLVALFAPSSSSDYLYDLSRLAFTTAAFLDRAQALDGEIIDLSNAPTYIMQMLLAAGFCSLKLLDGYYPLHSTTLLNSSRQRLASTITLIRRISVISNDLPSRLAEVMAQLLKLQSNRGLSMLASPRIDLASENAIGESLTLEVKHRMSMSVLYDSVWRWREAFGKGISLDEAVRRPTDPESGVATPLRGMETLDGTSLGLNDFSSIGGYDGMPSLPGFLEDWDDLWV
ncbi:MAG: hypothetical protein M1820_005274 [Bogoriella megaspora]|nr:MAG: hypothetical protein M1820_005274 [Bogoriella megaspora]